MQWVMIHKLWVMCYGLWIMAYAWRRYGLRIMYYGFWATVYRLCVDFTTVLVALGGLTAFQHTL